MLTGSRPKVDCLPSHQLTPGICLRHRHARFNQSQARGNPEDPIRIKISQPIARQRSARDRK